MKKLPWTSILTLVSLGLVTLSVWGCDSAEPADEPALPEGTLLFVARDTTITANNGWRSLRVYKADLRTGRTIALTSPDDPGADRGPALDAVWSPDGRRIVYHEAIGIDAGHLTIMNADGSGKRTLSDPREHRALPMWGPDERTVLYDQRVYLGASVGLFALDVETAPASDPVCVVCNPNVAFGAELFVVDGDTIGGAVAPGPSTGTVVLASPTARPPMLGDYDVHLYVADYRTREVLRRLTEEPIHGRRFVVAPGGEAVLFMRYEADPSEGAPTPPSALYVVSHLGRPAVRVKGTIRTETSAVADYRWASDGQHVVVRQRVYDEQGYPDGFTTSFFDAHDPAPTLLPLGWVPRTLQAVPDLFIP